MCEYGLAGFTENFYMGPYVGSFIRTYLGTSYKGPYFDSYS